MLPNVKIDFNKKGDTVIKRSEKPERKTCKLEFECNGNCWMNVAGNYGTWETIAKHCNGTLKEQKLNDDVFNGKKERKELTTLFNFTDKEKETLNL